MLRTQDMFCLILFLVSGHFKLAPASYNPPECPQDCECDNIKVSCTGGTLPSLDIRQTSFHMCKANPPISSLNASLAEDLQHLVTLELDSIGLETIQPEVLGVISDLKNLKITSNKIHHLFREIFTNCSKLENLTLDNNKIESVDDDTFAPLSSLRHLSLAHNHLQKIPSYLSQLVYLGFQDNYIDSLEILRNDHLKYLNLCQNHILQIHPSQLQARSLEEVCFGGPNFTLTGDLLNKTKFPMLKKIEVHGELIHPATVKKRALENLLNMGSLRIFITNNCKITSAEMLLNKMGKLEKLSMKNTDVKNQQPMIPSRSQLLGSISLIDFSGSAYLAYSFLHYGTGTYPGVEILKLSDCAQEHFPKDVTTRFPNLKYVDLSHNPWNCSCEGLSWIQHKYKDNTLNLTNSENTTCDSPDHIRGQNLLTAPMCPTTATSTVIGEVTTTEIPLTPLSQGTLWGILVGGVALLFIVLTIIYLTYRLYRFCHKGTFSMRSHEDGKHNITMHRVSVSSEFILDN